MSKIIDYLLDLAADPDHCARFKASPETELRYTDLGDWEKSVLTTRDPLKISAAMTDQSPDTRLFLKWLVSVLEKPGD